MTFDELWGRSTPNSWARVPRGPAAVAVGSFLFGSAGVMATTFVAGVSLATIGGFLVTTAVTSWALSALAPKPPGTSNQTLGNVKEAVGDFDIVYGEVRKGGTITFMETSDRGKHKDDYLHFIIVLAGHEVEKIGDVYFNDEKVTLDTNGFVTGNRWKSLARVKKHLGSPNQLADPDLVAETSVDSNFRGRGIAYLYVRLDWDKDVFANGTPTITAMVKGRKVHDPRSNTNVWTDNAALCIRDYLREPFGLNSVQSPSSLGSSDWATAANVCDTLVARKNSSSEKRYTLNGVVSTANTPRVNLQNMLTSCGGTLFWGQGQWQFKVGYFPSGPYVSFNADDLRSGIDLVTKNSRKENFNAVTGTFLDKGQGYIEVDYPKIESPVFLQRDNNQTNTLDMSLPYTTSSSAAQRLAKMAMFRSREEIIINADFGLKATKVKVGDVIQFTFDRYGFSNKYFEVVSWKPTTDSGELKINLILRETSAAAYDWNAEEKDIIGNNTNLPDPTSGLNITNLSVTNRQTLQSDGSLLGEVVLSWDEADSAFIDKYVVQWKKSSETSWSATETDEVSIVIPSIKSGVACNYRVKAVNFAGFSGPWEQLTTTVDGKETPPGIPTNLQTKNLYKAVEVTWVNPTDRDLNHVEIWGGATSNVSNATLLGKSGGTKFIFNMEPVEEKWFFVRAVDNSDNKSAFTTGKKGTALFIESSDLDINVKDLIQNAGLASVEILGALPATGNFKGRTVFLTTDNKLYRHTGSPLTAAGFTASVPTVDLVGKIEDVQIEKVSAIKVDGQLTNAQIESIAAAKLVGQIVNSQIASGAVSTAKFASGLKPVEIVSSLPTSGNTAGRMVFLTTDNKLYRHTGSPTGSAGFTAAVPTTDLSGKITDLQIDTVAATKVSGQLTNDQIASVAAAKVAGQLTNSQIADIAAAKVSGQLTSAQIASLDATKVAGQLTNAQIAAIDAAKVSGQIVETQISNSAITTPKIKAGAVTATEIAANAVIADKILANAVTTAKINTGAVTANEIATNAVIADKILANAVTTVKIATGAVTANEIKAGTITASEIASNAITTVKINAGAVTATEIATNAVVSDKIYANAVTTAKINTGAVTANEIASNAVTTVKLIANAVTTDKIATNAVTANEIKAGTITATEIASNAITSAKIAAGAVTATEIAANAVIADKIASNAVTTAKINAKAVTAAEIATGTIVADNIASNAITTPKIKAGAVTANEIAANAVIADKILANAVTTAKIATNAVTANEIKASTITTTELASNSVTTAKIATNAVTANEIASNTITAGLIAAGAIQSAAIASNAVTADKINVNSLSAISANLGSITGGSINIGSGKFVVNSSGNATIRSGTSGERLVISNNRIEVYDSSGTLRVRLGQL